MTLSACRPLPEMTHRTRLGLCLLSVVVAFGAFVPLGLVAPPLENVVDDADDGKTYSSLMASTASFRRIGRHNADAKGARLSRTPSGRAPADLRPN
jgi:hypothetical protein